MIKDVIILKAILLNCMIPYLTAEDVGIGIAPPGFIFLGSLKNKNSADASLNQAKSTSYYFISQNAASWSTAKDNCKSFLGDEAHLVFIETEAELVDLTTFLRNADQNFPRYWTAGMYDTERAIFVWYNGVEFGSWIPWGPGQPTTMQLLTRVTVHLSSTDLQFQTEFATTSLHYICELNI